MNYKKISVNYDCYPVKIQYLGPDYPESPERVDGEEDDEKDDHKTTSVAGVDIVTSDIVNTESVVIPSFVLID